VINVATMKSLKAVLALLIAGTLLYSGAAEPKIRVVVSVGSDSDSSKAEIESYVKRELRSIGDVEIVEKNANAELALVEVEINSGGSVIGYAISSVGTVKAPLEYFRKALGDLDKDRREALLENFSATEIVNMHSISYTPFRELKTYCSKIVASFDSGVLERIRKLPAELKKSD
jgi:hypothetical protein